MKLNIYPGNPESLPVRFVWGGNSLYRSAGGSVTYSHAQLGNFSFSGNDDVAAVGLPAIFGSKLSFSSQPASAAKKLGVFRKLLESKSPAISWHFANLFPGLSPDSKFKILIGGAASGGWLPEQYWKYDLSLGRYMTLVQVKKVTNDYILLVTLQFDAAIADSGQTATFNRYYNAAHDMGSPFVTRPFQNWTVAIRLSHLETILSGGVPVDQKDVEGYATLRATHYVPFFAISSLIGASIPSPGGEITTQTRTAASSTVTSGDVTTTTTSSSTDNVPLVVTGNHVEFEVSDYFTETLYSTLGASYDQSASSYSTATYPGGGPNPSSASANNSGSSLRTNDSFAYTRSLSLPAPTEEAPDPLPVISLSLADNRAVTRSHSVEVHQESDSYSVGGFGGSVVITDYSRATSWTGFGTQSLLYPHKGSLRQVGSIVGTSGSATDTDPGPGGPPAADYGVNHIEVVNVRSVPDGFHFYEPDFSIITNTDTGEVSGSAGTPAVGSTPLGIGGTPPELTVSTSSTGSSSFTGGSGPPGYIGSGVSDTSTTESYSYIGYGTPPGENASVVGLLADMEHNTSRGPAISVQWFRPKKDINADGVCYALIGNAELWANLSNHYRAYRSLAAGGSAEEKIEILQEANSLLEGYSGSYILSDVDNYRGFAAGTSQNKLDLCISNNEAAIAVLGLGGSLPAPTTGAEEFLDYLLLILINNFASKQFLFLLNYANGIGGAYTIISPVSGKEPKPYTPPVDPRA